MSGHNEWQMSTMIKVICTICTLWSTNSASRSSKEIVTHVQDRNKYAFRSVVCDNKNVGNSNATGSRLDKYAVIY